MPFLSHQYVDPSPSVKTNWGYSNGQTTFATSYNPDGQTYITPKVGSYFMKMLEPTLDGAQYLNYTNNIAATWNQYTIEGWIYQLYTPTAIQRRVIQLGPVTIETYVTTDSQHYPRLSFSGQNWTYLTGAIAKDWIYFAVTKTSANRRFITINGAPVGSLITTVDDDSGFNTTAGNACSFGGFVSHTVPCLFDQIRISNVARYTYNQSFTPPTTAFTNDTNTWFLTSFENSYTPAASPT